MKNIFNQQIKEIFNESEITVELSETRELNGMVDEFVTVHMSKFNNLEDIGKSYVHLVCVFTAIQELAARNEHYTKKMKTSWN